MNDTEPNELISKIENILKTEGIYAALKLLNDETGHRYTGLYRYAGHKLQNIALYDRLEPSTNQAGDVPLSVTYCSLLKELEALELLDRQKDSREGVLTIETPVNSYCGVLIRDSYGQPFGSLCHWDMVAIEEGLPHEFEILQQASEMFYNYLQTN
jgi:hypothetical protein